MAATWDTIAQVSREALLHQRGLRQCCTPLWSEIRWNCGVGTDGQDFNKYHDNAVLYTRLSTNLSVVPHGIVFACPLISSATQDFLKQIDMVLYNFKPTWPQLACMATTVFIGNSPGSCSHGYWRIGNTGIQVLHDVGIKPKVLLCSLCSGIVAFLFCSVFKLCFWCCSQVFAMLHTFLSL